mmetsp:Transcript_65651/g.116496  ORF Transcript_65651/g.116496 Transcript_65651/m.116496 type:complete len:122 (+) Transcript_65651:83-448(+)
MGQSVGCAENCAQRCNPHDPSEDRVVVDMGSIKANPYSDVPVEAGSKERIALASKSATVSPQAGSRRHWDRTAGVDAAQYAVPDSISGLPLAQAERAWDDQQTEALEAEILRRRQRSLSRH